MPGLTLIESTTHFSGQLLQHLLSENISTRFPGLNVGSYSRPKGAAWLKTSVDWGSWASYPEETSYKAIELIYCFWAFLGNSTGEIIDFFEKQSDLIIQIVTAINYYCKLPDEEPFFVTINIGKKAIKRMSEFVAKNEMQFTSSNTLKVARRCRNPSRTSV